MSTYAIGDVQGCFSTLERLLDKIEFDPDFDTLWFTGDLVNRGPQSLETLRFIKNLPRKKIVLGNHDLHLLAVAHYKRKPMKEDTLDAILTAPDRDELIHWLLQQPLLHDEHDFVMVHAGFAPAWDLVIAKKLAHEVEAILQSEQRYEFFQHMYGNHPEHWDPHLTGWDRIRCITNYFTRVRFCQPDGCLELNTKESMTTPTNGLIPWFRFPHRANAEFKIIFGHWAALGGVTNSRNTFALDTGCVWGYSLTAMRLEDEQRFSVSAALAPKD